MTIYRIVKAAYTETAFQGSRGRGRWQRYGTPIVYAADAPATALLETLVHVGAPELLQVSFVIFEITLDADRHLLRISRDRLPPEWASWPWPEATQEIGTFWFESRASVVLEVPSAVVPHQNNYLINVRHDNFNELEIAGPKDFPIDPRLSRG